MAERLLKFSAIFSLSNYAGKPDQLVIFEREGRLLQSNQAYR